MFPGHLQVCFWLIAIFLGLIFLVMLVSVYKINSVVQPFIVLFEPVKKFLFGVKNIESKFLDEVNFPSIMNEIAVIKQKLKLEFQDIHWTMVMDWIKNIMNNFSYYDKLLTQSSAIYTVSKLRFLAALIISAIRKMVHFSKASFSELIIDATNILGDLEKK